MSWYRHEFTGRVEVHRIGTLRYRVVFLPADVAAALDVAGGARLRMEGEIADVPIRAAWQPVRGRWYVMLGRAFLKEAGLAVGDEVEVRFNLVAADDVALPEALEGALARDARARRAWEALTAGKRRALAHHVASARTEPTRARRVASVLAMLRDGTAASFGPPKRSRETGRR